MMTDTCSWHDTSLSDSLQTNTDFSLCIKCQVAEGTLVNSRQPESCTKLLEAIRQRAELNDGNFPSVSHRLQHYTTAELVGKAKWHSKCYKDTVSAEKIQRAVKAHQRKLAACTAPVEKENPACSTGPQRPFTRSACQQVQGDRCFFCGDNDSVYPLHEVSSFNVGAQIRQAVEASSNEEWKVKLQPLSPDDARAIDIKYHLKCYVKHVQRSGPSAATTASDDECARALCADKEFVAILTTMLSEGQILSMTRVCSIYEQVMQSSGLYRTLSMKEAKAKVLQNLGGDVEFARPHYKQRETICSSAARNAAIREAATHATNADKDMTTVMNAATVIRRDILNCVSQKWSFSGSLNRECAHSRVPLSLQMLLKWILQGTSSGAEIHDSEIERASLRLSQNIMYETKSVRQVSSRAKGQTVRFNRSQCFENDQVLAVAFKVHAHTRSKSLINYLNHNGLCVNYSRLLVLEEKLAKSVLENMANEHDVYVPPTLLPSIPVFFAVDNIDFDEDTADGKHTLHGTMTVAFQTLTNMSNHDFLPDIEQSPAVKSGTHTIAADSYLRQLKGSVTPTHSPNFKDFSCNKLVDADQEYREMDTVWLTNRCIARCSETVLNQPIPLWAGYNSLVTLDDRPITVVHTLPLLKSPAHEYNTLIDVLKQAQHITASVMGQASRVIVTFDMDLYIRAIKLQSLRPDVYKNYVFRLGEFHTVLCSLRAIGSFVENSGIDDAWVQSDIYSPATCRQILEGKHIKRALDAHVTTMQVLFDLTMELFSVDYANVYQQLQSLCSELLEDGVDNQFSHTDKFHSAMQALLKSGVSSDFQTFLMHKKDASCMFRFFWSYIELLQTLINFIRASRQGLWLLYLSSLEKLCSLFFSQNRLKYAQYVPEYIAKMQELEKTAPSVWHEFMQGKFCVKKSSVPFTSIGVDHAIEHVNRSMKVMGGIRGITQKPAALTRFFLIAPELARLSKEAEDLAVVTEEGRNKHHDLTPAAVHRQEQRISKLKIYMRDNNPLQIDGDNLQNFVTKCILPSDTTADIMNTFSAGDEAFAKFASERLTGDISLWDRMKRVKLKKWKSAGKTSEMKLRKGTVELKENRSLFARLALAAVSRPDINMSESIGQYEFSCISRTFFAADGSLLPCTGKSQLMNILEGYGTKEPAYSELHVTSDSETRDQSFTAVVDGMVVVQQLAATAAVTTCRDLADRFIAVVDRRTEHYSTLHVVFDSYTVKTSLKEATRNKRNSGLVCNDYMCSDTTPVTISLRNFIASVQTKHNLTVYLAAKLLEHYSVSSKVCIVSTSEGAKSNRGDVSVLSSNHEEADTMLILHAVYASAKHHIVHIMSPDTDVFVLALRRLPQIGPKTCIVNGTGSKRKLVLLQPIYDALGSDMVAALPGFHAFTGCDTTGRFSGKGKNLCWKAFQKVSKAVLRAFTNLGQGPQLQNDDFILLEEFVCRLYQPKSTETSVSKVRWNVFKHVQAEAEKLPPTPAALRQHILRAHYQCMIWCNDIVPVIELPEPAGYGWSFAGGILTPVVTTLKPAPEAIVELVRCKCTAGRCRGQCSCFVAGMVCTQMCKCDAHPETCDNVDPSIHDSGEDSDDTETLYHFPYSTESADIVLPDIDDLHEDQDVDHVVHLSSMEVDST